MIKLELTNEEAKKILHCLAATSARNSHGEMKNILQTCKCVEDSIFRQLNTKNFNYG